MMRLADTCSLCTVFTITLQVVMQTLPGQAQRTFMRSCDCEYTVDGKCAYTILLPTSYESPGSSQQEQCSDRHDLQTRIQWLEQKMQNLTEWNAEQTRLFTQLQSTLIYLQDTLTMVSGNAGCGTDIHTKLEANSQEINNVKEQLLQLQELENDVAKAQLDIEQLRDGYSSSQALLGEASMVIDKLVKDMEVLKAADGGCTQKGIIVSGPMKNITDDAMTSSTVYDEEHNAFKSRIFNEGNPGAWCPREYMYSSNQRAWQKKEWTASSKATASHWGSLHQCIFCQVTRMVD